MSHNVSSVCTDTDLCNSSLLSDSQTPSRAGTGAAVGLV